MGQVIKWLLPRANQTARRDGDHFLPWRAADARHEAAWRQLTGVLAELTLGRLNDAYPAAYAVATPPPQLPSALAGTPGIPARRRFLAGSLSLAGAGACAAYVGNAFYPLRNVTADAATGTGERRHYVLSDGSQLLLDARSRVNLDFTPAHRQVRLLNGAVTVAAAPDARRPFLVQTAQGTLHAQDAARCMVRQQAQRTVVVTHEREVMVQTTAGAHGIVRAGTGARFDASRIDAPRAQLVAEAAWETGRIDARDRPLIEVIAALRPYRRGALRISMAAGGLPVSGRFPLDDTDAALNTLQDLMPIEIQRYTPWFVSINLAA